jgi:hypothetical protein
MAKFLENMRKSFFLFLGLTLLGLGFAGEANTFVLMQNGNDKYEHWTTNNVLYRVNPSGFPTGGVAAIQAAFQIWEDVATADISFTYDGTTSATAKIKDGTNAIFLVESGWSLGASVAAFTT